MSKEGKKGIWMGYSLVLLQVTLKRQPNNSSPQNRLNEIYADFRSLSGGSFLLFSRAANHYVCILINALHYLCSFPILLLCFHNWTTMQRVGDEWDHGRFKPVMYCEQSRRFKTLLTLWSILFFFRLSHFSAHRSQFGCIDPDLD